MATFQPTLISLDFEMAVMNSVRQAFPRAELHGCLFSLTKSMTRQLSENGLLQRSNAEPQFAFHARMIVALAFVPIDNLETLWCFTQPTGERIHAHLELVGRQLYRSTWT